MRLRKAKLPILVILSILLLSSIPFGRGQTSTPEGVVINELMANNDKAVPGPYGDYPDWIELYNSGAEPVDLSGMYLTGNLSNPDAWQFASGTVIEPNGFLVVWADNSPERGSLHASFGLNANGEAVGLFATDGETQIDAITFGPQDDDASFGRLPDGVLSWNYLTPTPGSPNQDIPDDLFINEFMANNNAAVAGPNGTYPDWIELYNAGNETIDLGGMYLTDDLADSTKRRFPNETLIEPEGYLIIWADNSSDKSSLHAGFSLNANGEEVGLFASDGVTLIDSVVYTKQLGDVSYGRLPDGSANWEPLLRATPGWGNDKRQPGSETSVWLILLLIGIVIGLSALIVVAGKIHSRRKRR